ncbi:MAG: putative quinol monooxygenase [Lishizhenia sp.]
MIRIVKLTFQEKQIDEFLTFFDSIKTKVATFEGCNGMRLIQDQNNPNIVFTYSDWEDNEALENYRISDTFQKTWKKIKPWFSAKAEAWSTDLYFDGFNLDM